MKWIELCFALLVALTMTGVAQNITGTYNIYSLEKRIQTDEYEVFGSEKTVDVVTMLEGNNKQKIEIGIGRKNPAAGYYRKSLDGVMELRALVEKDYIWFYEREAKVGALTIDPYMMFFDPAAYSGYTVLVRAYDAAKGGSQTFPVIVPALQDYCEIEVERHGSDELTVKEKSVNAAHYRMALGKRETVSLWVDADRVIAVQMAMKGITAVDAKYPDLLKEIRRVSIKSL